MPLTLIDEKFCCDTFRESRQHDEIVIFSLKQIAGEPTKIDYRFRANLDLCAVKYGQEGHGFIWKSIIFCPYCGKKIGFGLGVFL